MTPIVQLTDVVKRYDELVVLRGISVTFDRGQTTAVVGESGCGKTTLLQLINGVVRPEEGTVQTFGSLVPAVGLEQFRARIGYAVQGAGLFPHLTSRENVVLLARLRGWTATRISDRYAELLQQMELPEDVSSRFPRDLSGGQQQRLGLCRAMMLEPELLLLDEPFSAIDPITRVGIYERFEQMRADSGVSSVLVTHDMREAVRLADQLLILREGRVEQLAPTREVVDNPATEYVASLVSSQL